MRLFLRVVLGLVIILIGLPLLLAAVLFVALNTGAGRNFAVSQINHFAGPTVSVAGLGGHFPADLKLAHVAIADKNGVWASGENLELRWRPLELLHRDVHVTSFTAAAFNITRAPAPSPPEKNSSSFKLPNFHLEIDHVAIHTLNIGAMLAGQPTVLAVTGSTRLQNLTQGDVALSAIAADGRGSYQLHGAAGPSTLNLALNVAEPPDGLLGHFAGPQVHDPLAIALTLNGPRNGAVLIFSAALGPAKLTGAGTLDLDPHAPQADVVLTVPAIAPLAALAHQSIAGATTLHLIARGSAAHGTSIALDGQAALTQAPGPVAKLVGPDGQLSLRATLANQAVAIQSLTINGAGFAVALAGTMAQAGLNLTSHLALNNVALLAPGMAGAVTEDGTLQGTAKDFAVNATLAGTITHAGIASGPFNIVIAAQHLPQAPTGTLIGSGLLENSPLRLETAFTRDAAGNATLKINNAAWRSLAAQADLALATGAKLPTGSATFAVRRLADFRGFAPIPLAGSVAGNFAHSNPQDFALNVTATDLLVDPTLGAIDAKLNANGPTDALAVKLAASIARVMNAPAQLAATATLNLDKRSVALSRLTASWRTLNAVLLGPALVESKPGLAIHHLALGLNGGSISLDGTVSPRLNLRLAVAHLPASLAKIAAPTLDVTGTLAATANLTGSTAAPAGRITLAADAIRLHSGPAAALPPANLTAAATLARRTANLTLALNAGPNIVLNLDGLAPLTGTGPLDLHLTGTLDLRLLDPILAAGGSLVHGVITPDVTVTGTAAAPRVNGAVDLANGTISNINTGLSLTKIAAHIAAAGQLITLANLTATAGQGTITGHGTADLGAPGIPVALTLNAANASPVSSDLLTESLDAALTLKGALRGRLAAGGTVTILKANINIPKSLPPSVANLPIVNRGAKPLPPAPPPPDIGLDLKLLAANQIFIRGDGLFAELGGSMGITGTAANPDPEGGFTLIRGFFSLGGKTLQFTKGVISFNGGGFIPTLDLEASVTNGSVTSSLVIGGTAAKPTITLTSSPPLPSDEVLSQLLFGKGTVSLSPFQAASLAAALAQLSGVGGGASPLDSVRNALGLDELSLGGSGSAPTVQAGRYVAPGVYVGAQQGANGSGTQATVEINLYKGLKLTTTTGASTTGSSGNSSSVGLTYQFNY